MACLDISAKRDLKRKKCNERTSVATISVLFGPGATPRSASKCRKTPPRRGFAGAEDAYLLIWIEVVAAFFAASVATTLSVCAPVASFVTFQL